MRVENLALPGVLRFEHQQWRDDRGTFMETWNEREFQKVGIDARFVQDNMSISKQWTVRGLHYQIQHAQGKLVRVLSGEIYDAIVDLRRGSRSFGHSLGIHLSAERAESLWVPAGFAHGFLALSEKAQVTYKVTDFWAPNMERTLLWNDPALAIEWPLPAGMAPIISSKDAAGAPLERAEHYA